ncbi:hypothetical protein H4R33_004538 [Dimargaris cristalligena]|nr:hypothetical protein H4R33_004538 [Dimargaris cristalligena]
MSRKRSRSDSFDPTPSSQSPFASHEPPTAYHHHHSDLHHEPQPHLKRVRAYHPGAACIDSPLEHPISAFPTLPSDFYKPAGSISGQSALSPPGLTSLEWSPPTPMTDHFIPGIVDPVHQFPSPADTTLSPMAYETPGTSAESRAVSRSHYYNINQVLHQLHLERLLRQSHDS